MKRQNSGTEREGGRRLYSRINVKSVAGRDNGVLTHNGTVGMKFRKKKVQKNFGLTQRQSYSLPLIKFVNPVKYSEIPLKRKSVQNIMHTRHTDNKREVHEHVNGRSKSRIFHKC
jgi:hypothetical protein